MPEAIGYVPEEAKDGQSENEKALNQADEVLSVRQGRPDVNAHQDQMARYGVAQALGREGEFTPNDQDVESAGDNQESGSEDLPQAA